MIPNRKIANQQLLCYRLICAPIHKQIKHLFLPRCKLHSLSPSFINLRAHQKNTRTQYNLAIIQKNDNTVFHNKENYK
ncbi:hypothetical protein Pfra02_16400 [Pseudomonas fragi]|nr:hypothetical protein Pfra02_16400 [Pseudomonas fragi]